MDFSLICQQVLNGLQFGVMLFLMASGLTLVFGIMDLINLAHGSLFMVGAYLCAMVFQKTGSFLLGLLVALPGAAFVGIAVEVIALRKLYARDHLDQVLEEVRYIRDGSIHCCDRDELIATYGALTGGRVTSRWGPRSAY